MIIRKESNIGLGESSLSKSISDEIIQNSLDPKPVLNPRVNSSVSVLISADFVVSSRVQDNLLISISLQKDSKSKTLLKEKNCKGNVETKRNVLVGVFTANSPFTRFVLTHDATRVATEPNAGGTSIVSEALSVEYFVRRFRVKNVVTEMEVKYRNDNWKKVDYICDFFGQRVGVSVTRAMSYPDPELFSREKAISLLRKKLYGLTVARSGVCKKHSFVRAILHVWCETMTAANCMQQEFYAIAKDYQVEDDVIMVLTIAEGMQGMPIFYESKCSEAREKNWNQDLKSSLYPFWWLTVKSFKKKVQVYPL